MTLVLMWLPYVVASAAVGYFGRKRVIGFWGFFVLSLIISPIVPALFLALAAPGRRYREETEERLARSLRRSAVLGEPRPVTVVRERLVYVPPRAALLPAVAAWLGVVAAFTGVYYVGSRIADTPLGIMRSLALSFDAATLGSGAALRPEVGIEIVQTGGDIVIQKPPAATTPPPIDTIGTPPPAGSPAAGGTVTATPQATPGEAASSAQDRAVAEISRAADQASRAAAQASAAAARVAQVRNPPPSGAWFVWLVGLERLVVLAIVVVLVTTIVSGQLVSRRGGRDGSGSDAGSGATDAPVLTESPTIVARVTSET